MSGSHWSVICARTCCAFALPSASTTNLFPAARDDSWIALARRHSSRSDNKQKNGLPVPRLELGGPSRMRTRSGRESTMAYADVDKVLALRDKRLSGTDFAVLVVLASHKNKETGQCNPGYALI